MRWLEHAADAFAPAAPAGGRAAGVAAADATRVLPDLADAQILLVDDDPIAIQWMARVLAGYRQLRIATGGAEAIVVARRWSPELVLLDAEMPGVDGFEVCRTLKADPLLADVPVVFVTQHAGPAIENTVFSIGAADFITKPVTGPALRVRVAMQLRLRRASQQLLRLGTRDPASGLSSRRHLEAELAVEWRRAQRGGRALALVLIDVAALAQCAALHGAAAGTACLQQVAQALAAALCRPADLAAQFDDERLALLLPDTDATGAAAVVARLGATLERVAQTGLPDLQSALRGVRVGAGVLPARADPDGAADPAATPPALAEAALAALEAAAPRAQPQVCEIGADGLPLAARPLDGAR